MSFLGAKNEADRLLRLGHSYQSLFVIIKFQALSASVALVRALAGPRGGDPMLRPPEKRATTYTI